MNSMNIKIGQNHSKTIAIIGAGPAGNYAAELLAKSGFDVHVFEEHSKIGEPWQCTGIVTDSINKIINLNTINNNTDNKIGQTNSSAVINKTKTIRIYSPENNFIDFKLSKENIILNRAKFDQLLAKRAKEAGAKYHLNNKFIDFKISADKIVAEIECKENKHPNKKSKTKNKAKEFFCDYLIGADGPFSAVAKTAGMFGNRKFYYGMQARINLKNENIVETFPNVGAFSWIVPENKNIARIGVIADKNLKQNFSELLDKIKKIKELKKIKIIDYQAGPVPIYQKTKIEQTEKNKTKVFLIGDAALQVKATTFGGIIHGLMAAELLCEAINKNKSYQKLCNKKINRDLWLSLKIRKTLNKMTDQDYNKLIELVKTEKAKKILEQHDRDFPSKFIIKMIKAQPKLLLFINKLF